MSKMEVWKYPLKAEEIHIVQTDYVLEVPQNGKILTFQTQYGRPTLWILVNPLMSLKRREFRLYGTGHKIECKKNLDYIGTIQLQNGHFVYHLFELL